ncbi:MAG: hypothetical protein HYZ72_00815 [Deltaproteobacteria bacterium]|nr:hypothetical protein [Deltaproteobacteria bacterium]
MHRHPRERGRGWRRVGLSLVIWACLDQACAWAIFLDKEETLRFNGRVYNRTAMATQDAADNTRLRTPYNSWNMLQNRTFIQMELRHNLTDLVEGRYTGLLVPLQYPLALLRLLDPDDIDYFVTYRGEYDGVWDYGPDIFSERFVRNSVGNKLDTRQRLRHRHRLFEAYVDYTKGPLFLRIGRQNLSWGETDVFRLLDQINPLDASFGGFLVALDERRVPLDMLRVVYGLGSRGPFSELDLEGYVALDDKIAEPVPAGSPWATPNPAGINGFVKKPAKNFTDARGGGRIIGVLGDFTLSVAHFYTYLDAPALRIVTPVKAPGTPPGQSSPMAPPINLGEFEAAVKAGQTSRFLVDHFHANVLFPKIQISGATVSFSVPQLYAVVRSEFAYFYAEPFFLNSASNQILGPALTGRVTPGYKQVGTDPRTGKALLRYKSDIDRSDVVRWSLGFDVNRYIRFLNPSQSFLISAQAFGTHILDFNSTPLTAVAPSFGFAHFSAAVRDPHRKNQAFVNLDPYQIINTLLISTSYRSGVISPALAFFYDWQGSWVVQPGVTFTRDPFRLTVQYNYIDGQFNGVGFLRDRDNVIIQLEVVI